jgi:hypothetical protein
LRAAAGGGRLDILKYLVEKLEKRAGMVDAALEATPKAAPEAALEAAARIGHLAAVDYLLHHGVDVNCTTDGIAIHVPNTATALLLASWSDW